MPDRSLQAEAFLTKCGWGAAERVFLAGDASSRSYQRLSLGSRTAVLMDAPPGSGEDTGDFVRIARHLLGIGLSAPQILAWDQEGGFLLLEDLGDGLYARLAERQPGTGNRLYECAVDVLVHLQGAEPPAGLPDLSAAEWAEAAMVAGSWYAFAITGARPDCAALQAALAGAIGRHADGPRVMILRDYHAENLLWLPARKGAARVGLLDFQLAQMGQPGYDLVSLCQDARRDVPGETERKMIHRFLDATGGSAAEFGASCAVLGAQRALRILGVFARLCLVAGKPSYVALIPRVWSQLQTNLAHPALAEVATRCDGLLPEPDAERLERIRAQCASHAP